MINCLICDKLLVGRQVKFCSAKCRCKHFYINCVDFTERYNIIERKRDWRHKKTETYLNQKKRSNKQDRLKHKFEYNIRQLTYKKYGKLKEGLEYHHTTNPYDKDKFIIVSKAEHKKIHNKKEETK